MPPHPRVEKMIKEGKIPLPYHLAHKEEMLKRELNATVKYFPGRQPFSLRKKASPTFKALAILVQFSDHPAQTSPADFDSLLYGVTGQTLRNYYSEVSYHTFDIVTVNFPSSTGWKTAPHPYSYYVNGQQGWGDYPHNAQKMLSRWWIAILISHNMIMMGTVMLMRCLLFMREAELIIRVA
jgi:hypothetical protein